MDKPLVTVFLALYNAEKYISEALESILEQTYSNLEIIIVNDASTDNSLEIIKQYDDKRIRIINNEENKGIPYTRNVGLKEARGKYIAIMDSDDISKLDRIKKQVEFMEMNNEISAVGTYYETFGGRLNRKVTNKYSTPEKIKIKLLFSNPLANPSSMIRKSVLDNYNLKYNETFFVAQDYDLWLQISKIGKLCIMPEFLLKYRIGHSNISRNSKAKKGEERKKIIDSIHRDALSYYDFDLDKKEVDIFNSFFTDNPIKTNSDLLINNVIIIVKKMKNCNYNTELFNIVVFNRILFESSIVAINKINMSLKNKMKLYCELCKVFNRKKVMKRKIQISLKHVYNILKS